MTLSRETNYGVAGQGSGKPGDTDGRSGRSFELAHIHGVLYAQVFKSSPPTLPLLATTHRASKYPLSLADIRDSVKPDPLCHNLHFSNFCLFLNYLDRYILKPTPRKHTIDSVNGTTQPPRNTCSSPSSPDVGPHFQVMPETFHGSCFCYFCNKLSDRPWAAYLTYKRDILLSFLH